MAFWRRNFANPLIPLLGVFLILALIYAWATPPLEASDELWHFGLIDAIADSGELPVQAAGIKTPWEQEGSQPPLYYLISAVLVRGIDRSDFDIMRQPNPHAIAGVPGAVGNKNLVLHASPHPFPQGTALAVYVLRLFSTALGCITVATVYLSAQELATLLKSEQGDTFATRYMPLFAASLTAFNPMFLFITASVNNDNLVTALNTVIIWQILVMLRQGLSARRSIGIAILLALTSLSKLSGLVLMPIAFLAVFYILYKTYRFEKPEFKAALRKSLTFALLVIGAWLVIAAWWYLRNLNLYGELFGTGTMAMVAGVREGTFTLQTMLDEFQGFRFGYWGVFGAFNIMTFRWFYDVMDVVVLIAIAGIVVHTWRNRLSHDYLARLVLLALIVGAGIIGVISWTAQTYASQGRLLFPYIAAISALLAVGIVELIARIGRASMLRSVLLVFPAVFAFMVPFASIAPQYAAPIAIDKLPDTAQQVYARFGDVALVGYETPDQRYLLGEMVPVTVYWQVIEPSKQDLSLYLHATLDDGTVIGKVDSYPGAGRLQTTQWQAGAIYADTYAIPLHDDTGEISRLRVQVGWWDYHSGEGIASTDEQGNPLPSVMVDVGGFGALTQSELPEDSVSIDPVSFGGMIRLVGYQLDGDNLTLIWESDGRLSTNDTVFVQVVDGDNQVVGQGDAPPSLPTHYWMRGERFLTRHTIGYANPPMPGEYRLLVGWYNPVDFARLSVNAPDNAYLLMQLTFPR